MSCVHCPKPGFVNPSGACITCPPNSTPDPSQGWACVPMPDGGDLGWQTDIALAVEKITQAKTLLLIAGIIVTLLNAIAIAWYATVCSAFIGLIFQALALIIGGIFAYIIHGIAEDLHDIADRLGQRGGMAQNYESPINDIADQISFASWMLLIPLFGGIIGIIESLMLDPTDLMNVDATQDMTAPTSTTAPAQPVQNPGSSGFNDLSTQ
jgi:hypothetical protein